MKIKVQKPRSAMSNGFCDLILDWTELDSLSNGLTRQCPTLSNAVQSEQPVSNATPSPVGGVADGLKIKNGQPDHGGLIMGNQYAQGTAFERRCSKALADTGRAVMRAAGSKGAGKMDLVAFSPYGTVEIVQCKRTGAISPGEWNRLWEVASWMPSGLYAPIVIPLVACLAAHLPVGTLADAYRVRRGELIFMRLRGPKVPSSRTRLWEPYYLT